MDCKWLKSDGVRPRFIITVQMSNLDCRKRYLLGTTQNSDVIPHEIGTPQRSTVYGFSMV